VLTTIGTGRIESQLFAPVAALSALGLTATRNDIEPAVAVAGPATREGQARHFVGTEAPSGLLTRHRACARPWSQDDLAFIGWCRRHTALRGAGRLLGLSAAPEEICRKTHHR